LITGWRAILLLESDPHIQHGHAVRSKLEHAVRRIARDKVVMLSLGELYMRNGRQMVQHEQIGMPVRFAADDFDARYPSSTLPFV
jgi:hypothetical protein